MIRRALLVCLASRLLLPAAAGAKDLASLPTAQSPQSGPVLTYDVVVVGSSTGGTAAAIQAARMGRTVALIDNTDGVGGQMIEAGVATLDTFQFDLYSGIFGDWFTGVKAVYGNRPLNTATGGAYGVEPHVGRDVLFGMIDAEPNLTFFPRTEVFSVLIGTSPLGLTAVTGLTAHNGFTPLTFHAKVVIDATETGSVLALSPADYRVGRVTRADAAGNPSVCIDSATYVATIRKYPDGDVPRELTIDKPPEPNYNEAEDFFRCQVTESSTFPPDPNCPRWSWLTHNAYRGLPDSTNPDPYDNQDPARITRTGVNYANDVPFTVGDLDPANQPTAFCRAKQRTYQFLYYMQNDGPRGWAIANDEGYDTPWNVMSNDCPDFDNDDVERHMSLIPYIREGRRLIGLHTLTAREIKRVPYTTSASVTPGPFRAQTHFTSSIALGDYPVDLHGCADNGDLETAPPISESLCDLPWVGAHPTTCPAPPPGGAVCSKCLFGEFVHGAFQVPMGTLIPASIDGLLAGDKNISASRLAAGALRLQPSTMLIGQASGALAALAVRHHTSPRAIPAELVQSALLLPATGGTAASVSIYQYGDVSRNHPNWAGVQMVSTHELLVGDGVSEFKVNDPTRRNEGAIVAAALRGLPLQACNFPQAEFADVGPATPGCSHIEALKRAGFVSGCAVSPARFCPGDPLPREQEAVMMVLAGSAEGPPQSSIPYFADVTDPLSPYFNFIQVAFEKGYLVQCNPGQLPRRFCPTDVQARGPFADDVARTMVAKALTTVPAP